MQTAFGSVCDAFESPEIEAVEADLLAALRLAVAEIGLKELSFRLNVKASLLADALAERSSKGVRAAWLVTIIDLASAANAKAILDVLGRRKNLEATQRKTLTPEERADRLEEKLRSLGPVSSAHPRSGGAVVVARGVLIARSLLIEKLERERYELVAGSYTEIELASRRSWNRRGDELIAWLRGEQIGTLPPTFVEMDS